jgi:hypothetical protein
LILPLMALTSSGGCRCQFAHSPVTRRGSRERYDSVRFTPFFVRLGSAMIGPVAYTV